ncbi:MAG: carbamoyltransferase HypF, partial [Nitrospiraceae bacterium]
MRLKITISGLVQGMGFRPFIHRLATELRLSGYVLNNTEGVLIEAEGEKSSLDEFLIRIDRDKPELSNIFSLQHAYLEKKGFDGFEIRESAGEGEKQVSILPDIAVCKECREEITDPKDRRFLYPFTNCTNCGPRFTIIKSLPYDRQNTSMQPFSMCPDCEREYNDTGNRRFHAQPNACHSCGPHISLHDCHGQFVCEKERAHEKVTNIIRKGYIVAVKVLGGYHIICDATNEETV